MSSSLPPRLLYHSLFPNLDGLRKECHIATPSEATVNGLTWPRTFIRHPVTSTTSPGVVPGSRRTVTKNCFRWTVPYDYHRGYIVPVAENGDRNQFIVVITDRITKLARAIKTWRTILPYVGSSIFDHWIVPCGIHAFFSLTMAHSLRVRSLRLYVRSSWWNTSGNWHIFLKLVVKHNFITILSSHACLITWGSISVIGINSYIQWRRSTIPRQGPKGTTLFSLSFSCQPPGHTALVKCTALLTDANSKNALKALLYRLLSHLSEMQLRADKKIKPINRATRSTTEFYAGE